MGIGELFNLLLLEPMLNTLVLLYGVLFHNFGLTIAVFTLAVRLATLPLTLRQLRSTRAMQEIQPKLQQLQKRYAKDRQRLNQEQWKLYREYGVNPLGCLWPMLVQFPIWIGLYQSVIWAVAATPERMVEFSQHLYSWLPAVHEIVPLRSSFLWLTDLSRPDPTVYVLPSLVGITMWLQQKMMATPTGDPRQQQMNSMMQWMMPAMFAVFTMQFPSGLALYWVFSNIVGMAIQYFVTGWGGLGLSKLVPRTAPVPASSPPDAPDATAEAPSGGEERKSNARSRSRRKVRRRSRRSRS